MGQIDFLKRENILFYYFKHNLALKCYKTQLQLQLKSVLPELKSAELESN